ncbi:hypothetical protein EJ03DRAFT_353582 [Teratosphaeria nubilosa]|uniref:Uncharacterized protein n=1 Tax=Teratosphaeria nubilosa TaxID=161662 RepID=A0A6G1L287_9PEZI|nr:hypothetical protein EJ03DRAFT_353582 [Teratosphaeria nubilosa]
MRPTTSTLLTLTLTLTTTNALLNRQSSPSTTPSMPQGMTPEQYSCHADCGYCILGAQTQPTAYCTNSTWQSLLAGCEACANTADVWQYYGADVQSAAANCSIAVAFAPSSSSSVVVGTSSVNLVSSAVGETVTGSVRVISTTGTTATTGSVVATRTRTVSGTETKSSAAEATRGVGVGGLVAVVVAGVGGLVV